MRTSSRTTLVLAMALALAGTACGQAADRPFITEGQGEGGVSLEIVSPQEATAGGNTLALELDVSGVEIVAADGDTSGQTGHFHVFIDQEPVAVGETIGRGPGIVHTTENPVRIYGLTPGTHTFAVVLGDGTHTRIHPVVAEVEVELTGPSVKASAPAEMTAGAKESMTVAVEGFELVAIGEHADDSADDHGDHGGASMDKTTSKGHLHFLINPEAAPSAGMQIPAPKDGKVVHSDEPTLDLSGLPAGEHTIWVVAGTSMHKAFDPLVADKVTVVVK